LTNKEIHRAAHEFLRQNWEGGGIPVDIELLVEKQDYFIIPLPGLRSLLGIDACSRISTKEIYVDGDFYSNPKLVNRFRFTLAHELGHFILHETEYLGIECAKIRNGVEWARLVRDTMLMNVRLESEADEFAGELLVARGELAPLLPNAISEAKQQAQHYRWDFDSLSSDTVRAMLGWNIAPRFGVTNTVVEIRIRKHSLYPPSK
jgi:hypothetical protein